LIQEKIRQLIETKLNDNTQNKKFIVGKYIYSEDEDRDFVYNVKTGCKLIEKNFIPSMIDFSGNYQAIPDQINGNATIGVQFLLEAEEKEKLDNDLSALDEVLSKIIGNHEMIVDGSITYESVWTMDIPIPAGVTSPMNGVYYTRVDTTISISFSDTNRFGNSYRYYLDDNLIVGYDGQDSRENTENAPHLYDAFEAKGGNDESVWSLTLTAYIDSYLETEFADTIASETYNMHKVYTFKEKKYNKATGLYTTINTFPVQVRSVSKPILLGEKSYITISLFKSDRVAT
jgi:hypothetical protein